MVCCWRSLIEVSSFPRLPRPLFFSLSQAAEIDEKKLIDQHYYAIASKATILKPAQLNVPTEKFKDKFGLEWSDALASGKV